MQQAAPGSFSFFLGWFALLELRLKGSKKASKGLIRLALGSSQDFFKQHLIKKEEGWDLKRDSVS